MNPIHGAATGASEDASSSPRPGSSPRMFNMSIEDSAGEANTPRRSSFFGFGPRLTSVFRNLQGRKTSLIARATSHAEGSEGSEVDASSENTGSSLFGAGFNFVNSIVGAGIIGMPIAIKESGFFMGLILLVTIGWLISKSTVLLIDCGIKTKRIDLEQLCEHVLGPNGFYAATLFMFLYAFGAMIAYIVIIGDTVPVALDYFIGEDSPSKVVIMLISSVAVILPLCMMRDMSSLASTSLASVTADFIMIIFICIRGPIAARNQDTQFENSDINFVAYSIFEGIGTFSFAFVCQHNSFIVYRSMKDPSLENWTKICNGSLMVAGSMCLALGLGGYLSFGSHSEGDILNNFSEDDEVMLAARLLLALTMVFTFPMECFVARHAVFSAYHKYKYNKQQKLLHLHEEDSGDDTIDPAGVVHIPHPDPNHEPVQALPHVLVTLVLWGIAVFIAIAFGDLRIVLALTGALAASMLGYILPAVVYIKTYETEWLVMLNSIMPSSNSYKPLFKDRIVATHQFLLPVALFVFGVMAMVIGVATVIYDITQE
jgi:sodium-coupled neutral amino acid transporter 11